MLRRACLYFEVFDTAAGKEDELAIGRLDVKVREHPERRADFCYNCPGATLTVNYLATWSGSC